jgi:CRP-like cAMP-binding protein
MHATSLLNIPLFKDLAPEVLSELSARLRVIRVKKDDVLFRKEMEGTTLYVISEGVVKVVLLSRIGEEMILDILSDGAFFGETSLLDGMPRSTEAVALEPSTLLMLNRRDFLHLIKQNDTTLEMFLSYISSRMRKAENLLEDTSFLTVRARVAKKLVELADTFGREKGDIIEIGVHLSQSDLGRMVGASRESINKELCVLRKKGLVTMPDKLLRIHNLERIKRRIH